MILTARSLLVFGGVFVLLAGLFLFFSGREGRHALSDQNVMQAVQERMTGPGLICLPTDIQFGKAESLPTDERSAREVADLSALGLVQADADLTDSGQLVLRVTAKGQPFFNQGKLCLAQYRYGHLKSTADRRVSEGGLPMVNAKIDPVIEPLPGVAANWLDQIHSIVSVRGMDAELVDTLEGWQANSVSLY